MKILAIFDDGGETLDRYTVVTNLTGAGLMYDMLGLSDHPTDPQGFSQWTTGQFEYGKPNSHLGKQVTFENLSEELQNHIAQRVFGAEL